MGLIWGYMWLQGLCRPIFYPYMILVDHALADPCWSVDIRSLLTYLWSLLITFYFWSLLTYSWSLLISLYSVLVDLCVILVDHLNYLVLVDLLMILVDHFLYVLVDITITCASIAPLLRQQMCILFLSPQPLICSVL